MNKLNRLQDFSLEQNNSNHESQKDNEGDNKILKKIGEETAEFIMACKDKNPISVANEAADLLFHLQVSLAHQNVSWEDVQKVLIKRRGAPRRNQ